MSLSPDAIEGYDNDPPKVRQILDAGLALTKQNLGYTYGSADPANGGMDCSGFIYYVLKQNGFPDVPRDSSQQYVWVRKAGNLYAVLSRKEDSFEFDDLKPGDLLFWRGTYNIDRTMANNVGASAFSISKCRPHPKAATPKLVRSSSATDAFPG